MAHQPFSDVIFFCISQQALEWGQLLSLKEETPVMSYAMPEKLEATISYLRMLYKQKGYTAVVSFSNIYREEEQ